MRYLLLFCLLTQTVLAQTDDGIFVFTIHDGHGHYLTPGGEGVGMQVYVQYEEDLSLPVQQMSGTELLYVRYPKSMAGKYLLLEVSRPGGNKVDIMQIALLTASPESDAGCYRCWLSNILFNPSRLMADMPTKKESWDMLPSRSIFLSGEDFSCLDISILQPFAIAGNK